MSANIIIYNASAGSGKTYQLSINYLKLLKKLQPSLFKSPKNILAITFTNKAAFEMKERIITFLKEISKKTKRGKYLSEEIGIDSQIAEKILEEIFLNYDNLQIKTIDSFLLLLYKALSYELGIVSNFQIKPYIEENFIEKALNKIFEEAKNDKTLFSFLEILVNYFFYKKDKVKIDIKNTLIKFVKDIFQKITYKKELASILNAYEQNFYKNLGKEIEEKELYLLLYSLLKKNLEEVLYKEKVMIIGLWKEKLVHYLSFGDEIIPWIYVKLGNLEGIIIDELQDTDRLQWEAIYPIIEDLISRNKILICAGDPKQSIFQWRGGDPFILEEIKQKFSDYKIKIEVLDKNYRSAPEIVSFNNTFFLHFKENEKIKREILEDLIFGKKDKDKFEEKEKVLELILKEINWGFESIIQHPINNFKGKVVYKWLLIPEEIKENVKEQIKKEILNILKELKKDKKLEDTAILVRKNEEVNEISSFLISEGFKVIGSSFLKLKESPLINSLISLLKFVSYPEDEIALAGFLSSDFLKEGKEILKKFNEFKFTGSNLNLIDFVRNEYPSFWNAYIEELFENIKYLSLYEFCYYLIKKFRLENIKKEKPYLYKFLSIILDFSLREEDLEEFLEYWEKYSEDELEMPKDKEAIKVITIHLAKGLEFKNVILPLSWEEKPFTSTLKLIFYNNNIYIGKKEELSNEGKIGWYLEKGRKKLELLNLLYVAFTRAIENLYILIPEIDDKQKIPQFEIMKIFKKIYPFLEAQN